MSRLLTLAALLALAGCAQETPVDVECSVDDTLVFVAYGVTAFRARDGMVAVNTEYGRLVRRMQENETCREVMQ